VDLVDELLDALTQLLGDLGELRVLLDERDDLGRLLRRNLLPLDARLLERLAVQGVGVGGALSRSDWRVWASRISGAACAACIPSRSP